MSSRRRAVLACVAAFSIAASSACAAELSVEMRPVVTCVYDTVRSHPGALSTDVYRVGSAEYLVEYTFRDKTGALLTGRFGLYTREPGEHDYAFTNESPAGQPDDHGSAELDFLADTIDDMMTRCHLMPTLMDTFTLPGSPPDPTPAKVEMPAPAKVP